MQSVMRTLLCAAAAITISLLTACGSGSGTTVPASIRLVNAATVPLTLNLNSQPTTALTSPDSSSPYVSVSPSQYTVGLQGTGVSTGAGSTIGLGTGQQYTTIAFQQGNSTSIYAIVDNQGTPAAGSSSLNVANISVDAGSLDVYVVPHPYTSLTGYSPTFPSVQGTSTIATLALTAAGYDVVVTGPSSPNDLRFVLSNPPLASAQQYTLALTGTTGGGLVNSILIPQGISVPASAFLPNTNARVRIWSAVPGAPALEVLATVGSTVLKQDAAPFPSHYQVVPAGSKITALTIGGTPVALPADTFAAGGDYTILVYSSGPSVATVLTDINRVVQSRASVRVINAAITDSGGVSLLVNGNPESVGVPFGTDGATAGDPASAYYGVLPASGAKLQLQGGASTSAWTVTGVPLVSGSVTSVLVYDLAQPPVVITDR
jgi:hypothetical protein